MQSTKQLLQYQYSVQTLHFFETLYSWVIRYSHETYKAATTVPSCLIYLHRDLLFFFFGSGTSTGL